MFDLLKTHVKDYRELLCTKYLAYDIINLVRSKTGKIEAADGFHDDMVMAYNHVLYILYYGYKIERFGILKDKCTFQKAKTAVNDYEQELTEEHVNNIVPYSNPDAFENQMLREMLSSDPTKAFSKQSGYDIYGYKQSDYNSDFMDQQRRVREEEAAMSMADLAFFYDVNQFF
jgi:hypothetical protein